MLEAKSKTNSAVEFTDMNRVLILDSDYTDYQ